MLGAYFQPSIGLVGPNLALLECIGTLVRGGKQLFILAADFNMAPDVLEASSWLETLSAVFWAPADAEATCTNSRGEPSLIDYFMVSASLAPFAQPCVSGSMCALAPACGHHLDFVQSRSGRLGATNACTQEAATDTAAR